MPSWFSSLQASLFQSTPSARRATNDAELDEMAWELFQSTPSARRATKDREPERDRLEISIHALREESDARLIFAA